jgi:hypothetical protein
MALSYTTRVNTRATIAAAGTSVPAGTALPDNCHTIIFLSREAAGGDTIFISQGAAGAAIPDNGAQTTLPPAASLTWEVGFLSQRPDPMTDLIFDCDANAANCDITYLCSAGKS